MQYAGAKIATCWFAGYTTSRRDASISRKMAGPRLGIAPMAGTRLGYCAEWLAQGWVSHQMVAARLEDCAEWLARGMRITPNGWLKADYRAKAGRGAMAANGLSAKKQQSNGNQGITPANWKNCGAAIDGSHGPKEKIAAQQLTDCSLAKRKIAARQLGYRAGQKKKCSTVIDGLRRPTSETVLCPIYGV
jgi:hypothetical protein